MLVLRSCALLSILGLAAATPLFGLGDDDDDEEKILKFNIGFGANSAFKLLDDGEYPDVQKGQLAYTLHTFEFKESELNKQEGFRNFEFYTNQDDISAGKTFKCTLQGREHSSSALYIHDYRLDAFHPYITDLTERPEARLDCQLKDNGEWVHAFSSDPGDW
ncbi:uncharacterized protein I303_106089 [Kwoniella dejecticola CBS 10117]|uniref:Uncharacterized protein n=1 Tax=Kwoniella dejecticola CBS 10117 TaxID=1296121 RepID=A0A1A6A195_9TREE|nr:uncharacterized protein I303_06108 [Kwoniella dejecticola CBS 10117]OBR83825.1 hypothetical protein I303_06108 [Kwoniella dejecticola CBS 10117]